MDYETVKKLADQTGKMKKEIRHVKHLVEKLEKVKAKSVVQVESGISRVEISSRRCPVCNKEFVSIPSCRNYHEHLHLGKSNGFDCEVCGRKLSTRQNLFRYVRMHEKTVQSCEKCGKEFGSLQALKNHQVNHRSRDDGDEEKLRCPYCKKIPARTLKKVQEHVEKCGRVDRFHCTISGCTSIYNHKRDLIKDMNKKHL